MVLKKAGFRSWLGVYDVFPRAAQKGGFVPKQHLDFFGGGLVLFRLS